MNQLRTTRLFLETHIYPAFIISVILVGLFSGLLFTESLVFVFILPIFAFIIVGVFWLLGRLTDDWWYNEYDDNEWGRHRRLLKELEDLRTKISRKP